MSSTSLGAYLAPGDIKELVRLCELPSDGAEPIVLKGMLKDPTRFFGEDHMRRLAHDDELRVRAGLFPTQDYWSIIEHPEDYTPEGIARRRQEKWTVVFRGLQRRPGAVRELCEELVKSEHFETAHAIAIETPPGVQALDAHWDVNPVLSIQVSGRKQWSVHKPTTTYCNPDVPALWDGLLGGRGFTERDWERLSGPPDQTVTLEPGDVYYVPVGWVHRAVAQGEEQSLAVSVGALSEAVMARFGNDDHRL